MRSAQFRTWIERVFMSGNPDLLGQLGLLHPDNARQMQDVLGLGSWVLPANKQREVVEGVIDRLLQSGPIESVDPMTGQPTLLPSEPFDDVLMDPQATVSIAREWALSEDGSRMRNENPDGFENVRVYIQSILSLMAGPPQGLMQGGGMGEGLVGEEAVEDPLAQAQLQ